MVYEPWVNPYGANIGDLIARSGDAQAHAAAVIAQAQSQAAMMKANAWAGAVRSASQIPAELEARQERSLDMQAKRDALQANTEVRAEAAQQRMVLTVGKMAATAQTPEQFTAGIDSLVASKAMRPEIAAHIKQETASAGPDGWKDLQGRYVGFAQQYQDAVKLGPDEKLVKPSLMPGGAPTVVAEGAPKPINLGPGHVAVLPGQNGAPPTPIASAPFAPGTGQHVVNGQVVDASGAAVGAPIPKQETPSEVAAREAQIQANQARVKEINAKLSGTIPISQEEGAKLKIERDKLNLEREKFEAMQADAVELSGDALDLAARNFVQTGGNLPSMGMGAKAAQAKIKIINRASEMFKDGDLATQRALFEANKKALGAVQVQADAVDAFEKTAIKNIDLFLDKAKDVPDTKIPLLNTPVRNAAGKVFGSTDVLQYEALRRSAISEIAKVVQTPGLSGQLSDTARKEVESFVPENATLEQAIAVMKSLKSEMANRHSSYQEQIQEIQKRMAAPAGGGSSSAAPAVGSTVTYQGKSYRVKAIENGHAVLEPVQ